MIVQYDLKKNEKYNLTISMGSFGRIKLIIRWNSSASSWVLGAENTNGEPLFYGQTMLLDQDLFKPWRNRPLPRGKLTLIDNRFHSGKVTLPNFDNIENFSLFYTEE
jgi:hypothetical protein